MRSLLLFLLFSTSLEVTTSAQDGQFWHDLPPPANITNSGLLLERSSVSERNALYTLLVGATAGMIIGQQNEAVGWTIGGAALCAGVTLDLHGLHLQRRGAQLLQLGYNVNTIYDLVPDSVDDAKRQRLLLRK